PERLVVTNGTGEANYLAMARAFDREAGDEALLTDPVYPYYPGKVSMLGGEATLVPTDRDGGLDVAAIDAAASEETALIALNTPNNPTGAVYDIETVRAVASIADRVDAFTDALDAAGAEYTRPEGAFYVLARFDGFPGTMANVKRLIDEVGVAGMPGEAFGPARDDWIRFALVTPRATEAAERLADYFGE
ncbi:aminotransferase class I/II-fold pyridoxal phosphate-dependent enzyme, partial [Halorubrum sp. SD626R]|uniref:aminotransferase class I/II-fold pyridoxal phosphate-dependent enzyme n=1 Tax=Halorubrum sp. SD626R TaxID=1419722 RepID=UPI0010F9481F